MGISTEQWRSTIGCFSQPLKSITRLKNIKLRYSACVSFGVRTLLFLLLVVEGVEANPGPPRGRGRGSKGASGFGPPTGRGAGSTDYFSDNPNPDMAPLRRSQRLHEPLTNRQSLLNAWLTTTQSTQNQNTDINTDMNTNMNTNQENLTEFAPETPSEASGESESEVFSELGTGNTTEILIEIRNDVKRMNRKFDSLDKKVKDLRKDNKVLKKQNSRMMDQVTELTSTVENLETRVKEAERKNENLEAQSRRDNLKFYGIEDDRKETWEQTELKTRNYLSTQLETDDSNIKIERAHRLPSKHTPRPVIVKFSHFKDKERVLKVYREKHKNQQNVFNAGESNIEGSERNERPVRISEDFPARVTKARANLYPFMKSCHEKQKDAYLKYDKLVVEGQSYIFNEELGRPMLSQ